MGNDSAIALIIFIVASLLCGAFLKIFLKKSSLPYTVGLFILGLIVGVVDRLGWTSHIPIVHQVVSSVGNADPHALLYIFLPILIFQAAYEMDLHIFKKNLINALILAVPGVIIGMIASAALIMGLSSVFPEYSQWTWTIGFMFGALISATDPVAVVSLLKELKTSKRFSTLVDAESLLNDGTGIVLFMLFFNSFVNGTKCSIKSAVGDFFFVVLGGIALGAGLAAICLWILKKVNGGSERLERDTEKKDSTEKTNKRTDDQDTEEIDNTKGKGKRHKAEPQRQTVDSNLQNSVIILSSYLTFLIAESVLHVSGVIALVVFGLTVSYYGRLELKKERSTFVAEFWDLASYIANTLIFIIVGLVIASKVTITMTNIMVLILVYIGLILIRALVVYLFYPLMRKFGYGLNNSESVILTWGGLRGAVGLTLALIVVHTPAFPEQVAGQVLFLTAGIVALTLTINATSIGSLLRRLGILHRSDVEKVVSHSVSGRIHSELDKYLDELKNNPAFKNANWDAISDSLPEVEEIENTPDLDDQDVICALRLKILEQESELCWTLYNKGVFPRHVLTKISKLIDRQNDNNGSTLLSEQSNLISDFVDKTKFRTQRDFISKSINRHLRRKIIKQYELARCFIILQQSALNLIKIIEESSTFPEGEKHNLLPLKQELKHNIEHSNSFIDRIASEYPDIYQKAITQKAISMIRNKLDQIEENYKDQGFIK